ncbi:MAG: hypothetical protein CMN31_12615 [Sandaracinus sp.]|nr:hypothetical protein [Myxococcales bacterium]MAT29377.1 hypothetical protein [Sandaracinus sp.]MBJ72164.1 hypothetical protein [Sandaracinus sp.]HJL34054.1 hypothetical protein [Polyangiaceae bacterium LLY-WYZ-15_(1-7)]HJL46548.1 hypothetical protein [Polyangiaceae bacterium LLY-WYZ-15_(1-7)]
MFGSLKPAPGPQLGLPSKPVHFERYLASTPEGLHEQMQKAHGEDYGQALIDGDPEVDLEQVGRAIGETSQVYLSAEGEVLHAPPKLVEVILDPEGEEKERRDWEDKQANVNDELPVRWTGRKMKKEDALHRFVFSRTIQIAHSDGLTYDYLYGIASELAESGEMVLMGGGPKGKDPLVFQTNGTPYRGFLEGRVDGKRYQLLLHLSNMELKRPAPAEEEGK